MKPCTVHRDSKLQINSKHPIILATPSALFMYSLRTLNSVQVVVTDEADLMLTSGQHDIWEILSYFKGVESFKKKRKQPRRKSLQEISDAEVQERDSNRYKSIETIHSCGEASGFQTDITPLAPLRQFVFVAATLPSRGKKDIYNVLKEWLPYAEFVSTALVHHTVPTVDIFYVKVEEALKLPELLRCLNSLVGLIKYPLNNIGKRSSEDETVRNKENVDRSRNSSLNQKDDGELFPVKGMAGRLDVQKEPIECETQGRQEVSFLESVGSKNLRVLVFVNTTKAAEEAYNFLSDTAELEERDSMPWKHVTQNDKTITMWQNDQAESDKDASAKAQQYVVTDTGFKDMWPGKVGQIHKNIAAAERIETLNKFTSGELKVLICTDLASRGLDIPNVSHVIQLDFALSAAQVLHRTGRTARAGASGKGRNLILLFQMTHDLCEI